MPEGHGITVTGARRVAEPGVVDTHDHLLLGSPGVPGQGLTDVGIRLGRNPAGPRAVAEATGLAIEAEPVGAAW